MRFRQFICEEQRKPVTKEVTQEELYSWIKKNSRHYLNALVGGHDVAIYRGVHDNAHYSLGDTSMFRRKAANTTNEIQSFIATSPKWKNFPSRERAYICSTIRMGTKGHGNCFLVIPADNAEIGVCPEVDFWPSFREGLRGTAIPDIADLNAMIEWIRSNTDLELPEDNGLMLRDDLRTITAEKLLELAWTTKEDPIHDNLRRSGNKMRREGFKNMEDFLEHTLDPQLNDFTHVRVDDYPGYENREVWIEGKAAFIRIDSREFDDVIDQLKKDLYGFEI